MLPWCVANRPVSWGVFDIMALPRHFHPRVSPYSFESDPMPKPILAASLLLFILLTGCGPKDGTYAVKLPPPHGGNFVVIPGNKGLVEVVKKANTGKETSITGELTFYFFKDEATPYKPGPTTGTLTYGKNNTVTLKLEGDGLTTPEGPSLFKGGEPDGTLSAYIDGKSVMVPLGVR